MGWYFSRQSKQSLVKELTENSKREFSNGRTVTRKLLAHCYRGNAFSGVLWTAWEVTVENPVFEHLCYRYIGCDLLRYSDGMWGHKPQEESMGPYTYSCPLGYLKLVPESEPGTNAEWRQGVQAYHAKRLAKRLARLVK